MCGRLWLIWALGLPHTKESQDVDEEPAEDEAEGKEDKSEAHGATSSFDGEMVKSLRLHTSVNAGLG